MNVCDLRSVSTDVCIEFQRRGTQFELRLECVLIQRLKVLVSNEP